MYINMYKHVDISALSATKLNYNNHYSELIQLNHAIK